MSSDNSINFQSLNVVQDELIATIESSARELENFVSSDQEDVDALQASINGVQQIIGILKMLELNSASMLAEELLSVATEIPSGASGKSFERKLEVISNTFFILTRYLEFLQQVKHQVPVLLVPHTNALRKLRNERPLPESHFQKIAVPATIPVASFSQSTSQLGSLKKDVRRLRNMYQIGLTGLIRESKINNSISLMRRAVKRIMKLGGSSAPLCKLWWLADIGLETFVSQNMSPLETRKFLFIHLDKIFRQIELGGDKVFAVEPPKGLMKELIYLIILGDSKTPEAKAIRAQCAGVKLGYTEQELQKEYAALYGPSSHTISSLSYVLQTEIGNAKRTLEGAAESGDAKISDLNSFQSVLVNISEILNVIGMGPASQSLKEQIEVVKSWSSNTQTISSKDMSSVANNLLYLESLVADLQNTDLSTRQTGSADQGARDAQIASQQLAGAIKIVIEESLGGLSLAKRGLNSFADSNYDTGHIRNISKTLNSIRGAMSLLKLHKVAVIMEASARFVEEALLEQEPSSVINEMLETFADVIIAVEYYFDTVNNQGQMDDSVLKIAEESLDALGYKVSY